ncbi:helix-turn-helix domain-containing protein [Papillibacter cinnamivorans]|uniref:HTH cro/C1-type domain-containing protein n=1 Tax=Papillibacter cinnamivorans DSM 12816 TaxID=1122930 RepID=A0A1W1YPS0_9FIRM|nr:helix-turn-helix transcriptional regulator [Papillibacter cinnamivorans]SMC38210.1 hypothetical protein SAMN02745168_0606 [Papillibacter cinnamivorans DSM 12816]
MKLKEARLEAGFVNTSVVAELKKIEPRIDKALLSRMETGVVRPTPAEFRAMCDLYGTEPDKLFDPEDVDYGLQARRSHKLDGHKLRRKLTVRLTDEKARWLQPEVLSALGYVNKQHWLYVQIDRLKASYLRKAKKEQKEKNYEVSA